MKNFPRLAAEWDAFIALPRDKLVVLVLKIIDTIYREPQPFDFDRLMSAGIKLSQSAVPIAEIARTLIDWAHAVPTEDRLGMAAALLNGLWKNSRQAPMVFEEDLHQYLGLIDSVRIVDERDNIKQTLETILPHVHGPVRQRICDLALRLARPR